MKKTSETIERRAVLQIVPRLNVGGAERATVDVAAALVAAGYRALVMSAGGAMVETLLGAGAEHFRYNVASKNPWTIWMNQRRIADFIRAENVDLVHARSRAPAWSAYFATRTPRVPFVTTFHDAYATDSTAKSIYNSVMASGDRVIAISRFLSDHIGEKYPAARRRVVIIPRGIDFSVFDPNAVSAARRMRFRNSHAVPTNVPLIIMPARMSHTKGHELVLGALSRLVDQPFICLLIGPDRERIDYRARMFALRQSLNLEEKVRFVAKADLPAAYAAADLVLSPSQKPEGFGRVPVEAQAMGVPIIATALGATSETVVDGETGWLVPPGDADALADTINRALSLSPDERRTMAEKALRHVRAHFDVRRMCAATLDVYAELLSRETQVASRRPKQRGASPRGSSENAA
jgi:glycosyltransferase involved in cell wall biosynthesis